MNNNKKVLGKYFIKIKHHIDNEPNSKKLSKIINREVEKTNKGYTDCYIFTKEEVISTGHAECALMDNFNRAIGRKTAFKRAVEKINNKEERSKLWEWFKQESPRSFVKV